MVGSVARNAARSLTKRRRMKNPRTEPSATSTENSGRDARAHGLEPAFIGRRPTLVDERQAIAETDEEYRQRVGGRPQRWPDRHPLRCRAVRTVGSPSAWACAGCVISRTV